MKSVTQQWIEKAESDWEAAGRAWRARDTPSYDHICFHPHECAEEYLKGRLVEADAEFPKTHNLPHLLMLLPPIETSRHVLEPDLLGLKAFGVGIVYPGKMADKTDAQNALRFCRAGRAARLSLGLSVETAA